MTAVDAPTTVADQATIEAMTSTSCTPIGVKDVAALLDVKDRTVHIWLWRKNLPEPDFHVNELPAWRRENIIEWAGLTGRIRGDEALAAEYRALTGSDPRPARRAGKLSAEVREQVDGIGQ